jgi:hypothetical protein
MSEHKYGTMELGGNTIPLTKSGYPNCRYLTKDERVVVREFLTALNKKKQEELFKELTETLDNLIEEQLKKTLDGDIIE